MNATRSVLLLFVAVALTAAPLFGQVAISAKAGLINVADGEVYVNGEIVEHSPTGFVTIPKEGVLKTGEGRAEVLLTPGSFLRIAGYGSFRLVDNNTDNVVIDLLEGSALVEVAELMDENQLTLRALQQVVRLKKNGVYLIDVTPEARVRVYDGGEALVSIDDRQYTVKSSRELVASAEGWVVNKFDSNDTDPLYRWAKRRSEYVAMANLSAARTAPGRTIGGGNGMLGNWFFNPYLGTMTYVPWGNNVFSPFGFAYFNPYDAFRFYAAPQRHYARGGPAPAGVGAGGSGGRWSGQNSAGFGGMQRSGPSSMGAVRSAPSVGFGGGAASAPASGGSSVGGGASAGGRGAPAAGGARGGRP